jgi:NADPH:quinone reductase
MARTIRFHSTGSPSVLRVEDLDPGRPGRGAVLVRHTAIGVNFVDVCQRSGRYPASLPARLGKEAAGVVEEVGEGVTELRPGDPVAYAGGPAGSYAELRVFPADRLVRLPPGITDRVAAAVLLKGLTARYLLGQVHPVRPGETVLFHAAAGGVGLIAVQWLRSLGATVIGTVGSPAKAEVARAHGCDHVIVRGQEDVGQRVREVTQGRGVDVAYDSVGRTTLELSLGCLARRGVLVSFGDASGIPAPIDVAALSERSLTVTRPRLRDYVSQRAELERGAEEVFGMVLRGAIRVTLAEMHALAEAAAAHRALEERSTMGSLLLVP